MCLSTVYKKKANAGTQEPEFLCKNVDKVIVNGDKIVFTDIMGIRTEFTGTIDNIDLTENVIYVCEPATR